MQAGRGNVSIRGNRKLILCGVTVYCVACWSCGSLFSEARWQSGYAAACKAVDAGSIPTLASIFPFRCERQSVRHPSASRDIIRETASEGEFLRKTALVVDDSETARLVLQKILETHDLEVDTAESAEDAIDYLSDSRPDIIFMDHEMPGMDGLEAVSAIKDNPATATIPIMMYTAQQGELYVGQARALGAIGVLPKQLEPVEVSKVLESLRIIGEDAESREKRDRHEAEIPSGEYPSLDHFDQDLREMIRTLFDQQRNILRRELEDSQEIIARRVADKVRPPAQEEVTEETPERGGVTRYALNSAVAALGVLAIIFALLFWYREDSWRELQIQNAELQRALEARQAIATQDSLEVRQQLGQYRQSLDEVRLVALDSLEWAANQSSQYGINEMPMGDFRLSVLQELTNHLVALDFRGVVRIESHVGNFCMAFGGTDGYGLATPDTPAEQCDRVGFGPSEAYEMGLRQTAAFANFINAARARTEGAIRYEIISYGNSSPLLDYPPTTSGISAGAWNEIAANNNRVDVSLYPD
jgi:CheY-like chemotaxis protein